MGDNSHNVIAAFSNRIVRRINTAVHRAKLKPRRRRALPITDTEDKLIAAAAIIGLSSTPKNGNSTPAVSYTHLTLPTILLV